MGKLLRNISLGLIALLLFACRKSEAPSYQLASEAKTLMDISYGSDPKQKVDVYLPANRTSNTSVIILVHGGSFTGGDKRDLNHQVKFLVAKGYAVLNVNYRLVDGGGLNVRKESSIKIKDQVTDMSTIVDFAIKNAYEWVVSGKRIGMVGHSAGATLALLYSYDIRNKEKVQVLANIAGSLDLTFTDIPNWQLLPVALLESGYRYTGVEVHPANEQHYKEISPLYVANSNRPIPTLTLFPEHNEVSGLPKQDVSVFAAFSSKLTELKVPNKYVVVAGSDHALSRQSDWMFALDQTINFFNQNIK